MDNDNEENHVHFSEDTDEVGHTQIIIKEKGEKSFEVHAGFLQIYHKYKLNVKIPLDKSNNGYTISNDKMKTVGVKDIKLVDVEKESTTHEIVVDFFAYKEKLLKESLFLTNHDGEEVAVSILARVLGKGKGTPMLREGVTCIGVETVDDDSEASDWQGFE